MTTATICPILGPVFPVPSELHSSATFQETLKLLESKIDGALASGNTTHGPVNPNDTYSIQIFSTKSEKPLLDYHRRGPAVLGNRTIDGDSVYRIASASKLITVYLLLLEAGEGIFSEKVTKYLPELQGAAHWDDITIGSLAGYVGDITAEREDCQSLFDTTSLPGGDISAVFPGAFPPLAANETSDCSYGTGGCTREVFIRNLLDRRPAYMPNTTPAYSNAAFATLGLVLEEVSNSSFDEALRRLLVAPLGLNGTTSSAPNSTNAVIPGDATASGWDHDLSDTPAAAEDFDVGIVVMMAGQRGTIGATIAGVIIDELLPALDEAARAQADAAFAGTYTATNGLNSTLTLATAPGIPGLSITEWVSNGTDLRRSWLQGVEDFQTYPTNIVSEDGKQVSWRSTYVSVPDTGSPFDACPSWVGVDRPTHGVFGVDEYVFHLGEDGKAWGVEPKALKIVLEKAPGHEQSPESPERTWK
ncbi:hypothetical protein SLS64_005695 [Diaporthe eres]